MESNLKTTAFKHGLIIGLLGIITALIMYTLGLKLFVQWHSILAFIVSVSVLIYIGRKERNDNYEGFLSFKQAFTYSLIVLSTSYFIYQLHYYSLVNFIDPELKEITLEVNIEATESLLEMFGQPQESIDEQLEKLEEDTSKSFDFLHIIKYSWLTVALAAFFSLITGLILRRSKPEFE